MNLIHLKATIDRELLKRRVAVVLASEEPKVSNSPNQAHAASAVLRAARLVSVGNWLADKCQKRVEKLEAQVAAEVLSHAKGWGAPALPSVLAELDKVTASAFDWLRGELADDLSDLGKTLTGHTISAARRHFNTGSESETHAGPDASSALVLGAPLTEHLDKLQSDTLFRLKAAVRLAVSAGATAQETVDRMGLDGEGKVTASGVVRATDPLSAVSIGVRLFDALDNSLVKFIQSAVTAMATAADEAAGDDMGEDGPNMGYTWVSAADGKVCEFCEFMEGGSWDADKEPVGDSPELEQEPPAHIGCRCALLPCDLDQPLPSGKFSSYLSQFSDEEQKQAFGTAALSAYRRGELTPAQLMGQSGNKISLEQFKGMEPVLKVDTEKYRGRGAAEGGAGVLKQRADTQAQQLQEAPA